MDNNDIQLDHLITDDATYVLIDIAVGSHKQAYDLEAGKAKELADAIYFELDRAGYIPDDDAIHYV